MAGGTVFLVVAAATRVLAGRRRTELGVQLETQRTQPAGAAAGRALIPERRRAVVAIAAPELALPRRRQIVTSVAGPCCSATPIIKRSHVRRL